MQIKRILALSSVLALCATAALGQQNVQPVVVTSASTTGAAQTSPVGTGAAGSVSLPVSITGGGGFEFNASTIPTVQNASYTAGQSLGGLQTISIGSTNSLSGILTGVSVESKGGSTTGIVAYVWSKNPTNTTCTDKTNFVVSTVDNEALVNNAPILLTPAIVASGQDTHTYAAATNLVGNFVNGSTNTDLYVCLLANATVTPTTTSDLRLNLQGVKDAP